MKKTIPANPSSRASPPSSAWDAKKDVITASEHCIQYARCK